MEGFRAGLAEGEQPYEVFIENLDLARLDQLMARVGQEFPLECPNCGGDIRLIAFITEPGPIRKILTHLGEPLVPPPISPARGPPTDWGELVQMHDERGVFQATERRAARDRHPQPLSRAGLEVTTKRPGGRTRRDSALTPEKCHSRGEDGRSGKRFLGSTRRDQPAPCGSRVVQQSGHACGSAIGRPILYPSSGKLVVSAMLPCPTGSAEHKPRAVLLADAFTVDEDGFLVAAGAG